MRRKRVIEVNDAISCYECVKCEEDKMDRYTKFILTLIAILLALHLVKPWLSPTSAKADSQEMTVNIRKVGGRVIPPGGGIPIRIVGRQ